MSLRFLDDQRKSELVISNLVLSDDWSGPFDRTRVLSLLHRGMYAFMSATIYRDIIDKGENSVFWTGQTLPLKKFSLDCPGIGGHLDGIAPICGITITNPDMRLLLCADASATQPNKIIIGSFILIKLPDLDAWNNESAFQFSREEIEIVAQFADVLTEDHYAGSRAKNLQDLIRCYDAKFIDIDNLDGDIKTHMHPYHKTSHSIKQATGPAENELPNRQDSSIAMASAAPIERSNSSQSITIYKGDGTTETATVILRYQIEGFSENQYIIHTRNGCKLKPDSFTISRISDREGRCPLENLTEEEYRETLITLQDMATKENSDLARLYVQSIKKHLDKKPSILSKQTGGVIVNEGIKDLYALSLAYDPCPCGSGKFFCRCHGYDPCSLLSTSCVEEWYTHGVSAYCSGYWSLASQYFYSGYLRMHGGCAYYLGFMLLYVDEVKRNASLAVKYFKHGSEFGDARCAAEYGGCLIRGIGCKRDDMIGVKQLQVAANSGMKGAMYDLAYCHLNGMGGLPKNRVTARLWYQRAVDRGEVRKLEV